MGAICTDYDNDGDSDIVVANDEWPNFCFRNDGTGKFEEVGAAAGLAYNGNGQVVGNMGIDAADYDHDGWLDFFITTYQREVPILFHNEGGGTFRDVTAKTAQTQRSYNNSKWGCGFADFDNDGWKDIFVGIGHLQVNIEQYDKTSAYAARPIPFESIAMSMLVMQHRAIRQLERSVAALRERASPPVAGTVPLLRQVPPVRHRTENGDDEPTDDHRLAVVLRKM